MSWQVEHCPDSWAFLRAAADPQSTDVIITDPPFNEHVQDNLCSGSLVGKKSVPKCELSFDPMTEYGWIRDAVRVAKRWTVVWCAVEDFGLFKAAAPEAYVRGGIWYKSNAMGQLTADRPATAYEGLAILHGNKVKKRWNGRGSYGIWRANGTRGKKDRHPNEKPLDLCLKLVALFSERGETVFDPFCGSGAIGEACVRLGRDYIGLDQDQFWVGYARQRCDAAAQMIRVTDEDALSLCSMRGTDPQEYPL
jgi:16S rRNA G966 N2-methylase RsmD